MCGSGYEEVISLRAEAQAEGTAFFLFLPTRQGTGRPRARRSLSDPFSRRFFFLGRSQALPTPPAGIFSLPTKFLSPLPLKLPSARNSFLSDSSFNRGLSFVAASSFMMSVFVVFLNSPHRVVVFASHVLSSAFSHIFFLSVGPTRWCRPAA